MTDGLWRKDGAKEDKPEPKAYFKHEPQKPVATLFPAPDGKMYLNSTEYYRNLEGE